ncbi:MAG: ABC transporter permease subunit [Ignavibacteriales bacterium]|nr:MAG: ABC transporter permease subunit [Ignavibacteriales bacterium]
MKKHYASFILLLLLIFLFEGCSDSEKNFSKLEDLQNASIGAMTGTTGESIARDRYPHASIKSFDDIMDAVAALRSNQIDAVITAYPTAFNVCKHNPEIKMIPEVVEHEGSHIAVRKGNEKLLAELNDFIDEMDSSGVLLDMRNRWFRKDDPPYKMVEIKLPEKGEALKVGTSATREPFCFVDKDNNVTGHEGEMAKRIAAKLGRPIQFFNMKFAALIPALQSGKIDMIVAGMTETAERKKSVDFSKSYFESAQVILVKKSSNEKNDFAKSNSKLKTIDDLKSKSIGVVLGTTHDSYATKTFPDANIVQFKNASDLFLAIHSGKIDAAIYTREIMLEKLGKDKELKLFGDTIFTAPVAAGFNKANNELREKFNIFLKKIKADGTLSEMRDRWITNGDTVMPHIENSGSEGELIVGTSGDTGIPFATVKNKRMIGFDIELAERFAASIGRRIKFSDLEFSSLIASLKTNKIDMIVNILMITDERKKEINFSDEYLRLSINFFALRKNIEKPAGGKLTNLDDIADKTIGVYAGTIHDAFCEKKFPEADIKRFNAPADIILALKTKKIDVALMDLSSAKVQLKTNPEIGILTDEALSLPVGYCFNKNNSNLRQSFNNFLKEAKADGTYDEVMTRWFKEDPEKAKMPRIEINSTGKLLTLGVSVGDLPNVAIVNGEYVGFDIEFLKRFARNEEYNLKIITMEFSSLIAALAAGKVDIIADGICITEERAKQVDFSEPYNHFKTAVIALKTNIAAFAGEESNVNKEEPSSFTSFFIGVAESFHNNIIVENRYLLIIDGLWITIIISILSTLFGTILGGFICFMRMSQRKLLLLFAKFYISILRGTPVLVLLMIIFYVVFASVDIDPVVVSVIAFGLNFAAYVSEMFRTGIEGVDKGQTEAGIAIGFTKVKTFIYIVLPQAVRRILPVYKGEMISLVKMTSIVGYIAVQDLTKASDIIRSRTFDAFFPLIMVAVLYFIISWLLMLGLGYIERKANPKTSRG